MKLEDEIKELKSKIVGWIAVCIATIIGVVCYYIICKRGYTDQMLLLGVIACIVWVIGLAARLVSSFILYVVKEEKE